MHAVILSAGSSTRTYPLTLTTPKPMLKIANKPLLEHTFERLIGIADEVIIVIGYMGDGIRNYFGNNFRNIRLRYIEQREQLGTGHALLQTKDIIKGRFLVMMGDDLYSHGDIKNCLRHNLAVVASKVTNPENYGIFTIKNNFVMDIIEKPQRFVGNLANTGLYILDDKIFGVLSGLKKTERNEYELTDAIREISKSRNLECVVSTEWLPIAYPWDMLRADSVLRNKKNSIGKNSRISGTLENSSVGDNCVITGIVRNSIIMDNARIEDSVIEDSVIGNNVFFSGIVKPVLNIQKIINGRKVSIERIGCIIGDNTEALDVRIESGAMIWPGIKITNKSIEGDIIEE